MVGAGGFLAKAALAAVLPGWRLSRILQEYTLDDTCPHHWAKNDSEVNSLNGSESVEMGS